jgi:hypothetical protein
MTFKRFGAFISEDAQLLLEYDADKTWQQHGKKAVDHAVNTAGVDDHSIVSSIADTFNAGHHKDPYALHTTDHEDEPVVNLANHALLHHLEKGDPTPNKKYVQHIARIYGNGGVNRLEDIHARMKPALAKFDELAKRKVIPAEHRDIGKVKSLSQLEDLVDEHSNSESGRALDKAHHEKMKSQATITDHPEFTHIVPHTQAAASHFGKGTRWCTTSDETPDADNGFEHETTMFDHYNKDGPLQIMIPKNPSYKGEKYQYHYSSDQFMNEKDEPVRMPGITYHYDAPEGHPAVTKHVGDYKEKMDALAQTPEALNHPETGIHNKFLEQHATHDDLMQLAPVLKPDDYEIAKHNKNYSAKHALKIMDANPNPAVREKAVKGNDFFREDHLDELKAKGISDKDPSVNAATINYWAHSLGSDKLKSATDKAISTQHEGLIGALARDQNLSQDDRERLITKTGTTGPRLVASSDTTPIDTLTKLAGHSDLDTSVNAVMTGNRGRHSSVALAALNNHQHSAGKFAIDDWRNLDHPEVIDAGLKHPDPEIRGAAAMYATDYNHLDRALNDKDEGVRALAAGNAHTTSSHIDKALNDPSIRVRKGALSSPNLQDHHINHIVNNENHEDVLNRMFVSPHAKTWRMIHAHHIDKMIDRGVPNSTHYYMATHPSASHEALGRMLDHPNDQVRLAAAGNPILTPHLIDKALNDKNPSVGSKAIMHSNASKENLEKAYNSEHPNIVRHALITDSPHGHDPASPEWESVKDRYHSMKKTNEEFILEVSNTLLHKYVSKAKKSVRKMENDQYSNEKDNKTFKRKMYISFAQHARLHEEPLNEDKVRHPTEKRAYVEPYQHEGGTAYKASNKHGKLKFFNKHGREAAYKHAGLKTGSRQIDELSNALLKRYKDKAEDHWDQHHMAGPESRQHRNNTVVSTDTRRKLNNRSNGEILAGNKINGKARVPGTGPSPYKKKEDNVVKGPWKSFKEWVELSERQIMTPTFLASVNRRATKGPAVLHRKNHKMKGMFKKNKTQYVTQQHYKTRSQHDTLHLTTRSKHQLTDRWRDQRLHQIKRLKKAKNVHEDAQYLKNRQALHQAHADAGKEIGRSERDPELKRLHNHRAKKHQHAALVLKKLSEVAPRKKK